MARRLPGRVIRPTRREMTWISAGLTLTNVAGSVAVLLQTLNAAGLALRPFTIVRSRMLLHVESDQTAAGEVPQGVFTHGVVSEQAAAAGVASVPSGVTEAEGDFFVYEGFIDSFIFGDGTGFIEPAGINIVIDSKAQRKVGINEDIAQVIELRTAFGATVAVEGRMLIKLH